MQTIQVVTSNTSKTVNTAQGERWHWELDIKTRHKKDNELIHSVQFELHPTFRDNVVVRKHAPWNIQRVGWGTFEVDIVVTLKDGSAHNLQHELEFGEGLKQIVHKITLASPARDTASQPRVGKADSEAQEKKAREKAEFERERAAQAESAALWRKSAPRMKGVPWKEMHGSCGDASWAAPVVAVHCEEEARPGYTSRSASEFVDDPVVLRAKVKTLAKLIQRSSAVVAYTGAGISTSAGIGDYATKASASLVSTKKKVSSMMYRPTYAHRVLVELFRKGNLHHWVQQNHDGLPQKAGFPPEHLNEIHGAWYDPSNPVVPMEGTLRDDLCEWMYEWESKADLTLAIGTSLCGMNADRMVETVAERAASGKAKGAVIISLQQTQYDDVSSLRIFAKIDDVMLMLAREMELEVPTEDFLYQPRVPSSCRAPPRSTMSLRTKKRESQHRFLVPYTPDGKVLPGKSPGERKDEEKMIWDLSEGARVRVTQGPGKGFLGTVVGHDPEGHYLIELPVQREGSARHGKGIALYVMGLWWVETAIKGTAAQLPIVNVNKT